MPRRVHVVNTVRSTINRVECTPSEPQAGAPPNRTTLSLGAPTLGATAIGFSPIFVRLAEVGPITSAFWRVTLAAPALWIWALLSRPADKTMPLKPHTIALLSVGLSFTGDLSFWHWSIKA
jgi:hypothetical protein